MRLATLLCWLVTASLGAFMLRTWLTRGGLSRERARTDGLPPQLIFGHASLALGGFLVWTGFTASGARPLAWAAVGMLMAAIALGVCTVTLWTPYPARRPGELPRPAPPPWGVTEVVVPDTAAAAVEAVRAADARAEWTDPDLPGEPLTVEVTDELITRLLTEPTDESRRGSVRPNAAVLIPVAHGLMAMTTLVLAVTTTIT